MNEVKRYMNAIERHLQMDWKTKVRVMRELGSDFQNRRDAGQTDAEIMAELGTPQQAAAEFNTAFAAERQGDTGRAWGRPSRWRWLFLAVASLALLGGFITLLVFLFTARQPGAIGVIGGADGPTAIFVTGGTLFYGDVIWPGLFLAALAGFLLLGWCRADRRRLWLPIALCGLPAALLLARFVAALLALPKQAGMVLAYLRGLLFSPSAWVFVLLAGVLAWAVWLYRRK